MESTTCKEAEPFALRVLDDSMEPEFRKGCIIIVDPTGAVVDGAFVLAEAADGLEFRQLRVREGRPFLCPVNDRYPDRELDDVRAVVKGVIVQRAGTRRSYHKRY